MESAVADRQSSTKYSRVFRPPPWGSSTRRHGDDFTGLCLRELEFSSGVGNAGPFPAGRFASGTAIGLRTRCCIVITRPTGNSTVSTVLYCTVQYSVAAQRGDGTTPYAVRHAAKEGTWEERGKTRRCNQRPTAPLLSPPNRGEAPTERDQWVNAQYGAVTAPHVIF